MAAEQKVADAAIPSSARVWESAVIPADKEKVFAALKSCKFEFDKTVSKVEVKGDINAVGSTRVVNYGAEMSQTIQVVELSNLSSTVSWIMIASEPAVPYTSATHTITVKAVTNPSGDKAESFVEWTTDYSNDAKISVIEDSRHKKKEAFKALSASFTKN